MGDKDECGITSFPRSWEKIVIRGGDEEEDEKEGGIEKHTERLKKKRLAHRTRCFALLKWGVATNLFLSPILLFQPFILFHRVPFSYVQARSEDWKEEIITTSIPVMVSAK